jgi:hypothetical protein
MAFEYTKKYTVSSPPANIADLQVDNLYSTGSIGIGTANLAEKLVVGVGTATVIVTSAGSVGIGTTRPIHKLDVDGPLQITPGSSVIPTNNGDVVFQLTSNTSLTIKAKGSDGVVRSVSLTLA